METQDQTNLQHEQANNTYGRPLAENSEREKKNRGTSLTVKGLIVFALILLLMIPMIFISELVRERLNRQNEIRKEVSSKWADNQTFVGPLLVIPYKKEVLKNTKGEITGYNEGKLYILPETLDISGTIQPHTRHRSIFDVTVYQSDLSFNGHFGSLDLEKWNIAPENLLLEKAQVFFGLTDFRGLEEQVSIQFGKSTYELTASDMAVSSDNLSLTDAYTSVAVQQEGPNTFGLASPVTLSMEDLKAGEKFSLSLKIKGSDYLAFTPIGKTNTTHISSPWEDPSFIGSFLPNSPATISDKGFEADWKILHLNRSYPQVWNDQQFSIGSSLYGVKLLKSTDSYAKTERSVKYAILFIALTFALYFFIEILQKRKIHPLQYALVGISLCLFYTLLLAISEYINFNYAYLIATIATVGLITLYTKSAFGKWKIAALFGVVLGMLYSFIFILIRLQDGALLFGSIGLFLLLCVIMYYSRKIDWYGKQ